MNKIITNSLLEQIKNLVNSSMTMMYWHIGKLINDEILQNKRAEYDKEIVTTLSQQLSWLHKLKRR